MISDTKFLERFDKLNPEQKDAVEQIFGPVLVIAGPGSGKTELLGMRVANILRMTDALPSSILCLTYTDIGAFNMRERLANMIGPEAYKVNICTFHKFGSDIIANFPEYFFNESMVKALDDISKAEIFEEIFRALSHKNPLSKRGGEGKFVHLRDSVNQIDNIKSSGLSSSEFKRVIEANADFFKKTNDIFSKGIRNFESSKDLAAIADLLAEIGKTESVVPGLNQFHNMKDFLMDTLGQALNEANQLEKYKTKPITAWKNQYMEKEGKDKRILKDLKRLEKHLALAEVYEKYEHLLKERGYYDFNDMILEVIRVMEKKPELLYTLQEKYQFVLIDEFQDTSGAQMRIVNNLLNSEDPNVMVVGDDDQSIYKFQGANLQNILDFKKKYDPKTIVLTRNYRSNTAIINFFRKVVLQGEERLENRFEDVSKELVAERDNEIGEGKIVEREYKNFREEIVGVASEIEELIRNGHKADQIAVLCAKHKYIEELAKLLNRRGIAVFYERSNDVLKQRHVLELVRICEFLDTVLTKDLEVADFLLPEILCFEFWGVKRYKIWEIADRAKSEKLSWLRAMRESEDDQIKFVADFLVELSVLAKQKTAEEMVDFLTGVKSFDAEGRKSPFRDFYFSETRAKENPQQYADFLVALDAFISALRDFRGGETLTVSDLVNFVRLHKEYDLRLNYKDVFGRNEGAVQLSSAHGSKGLEFETVFVLATVKEIWEKTGYVNKLPLPANLPLSPDSDESDDKLRLFYVALSRAKKNLFITRHELDESGKKLNRISFLGGKDDFEKVEPGDNIESLLEDKIDLYTYSPTSNEEDLILRKRLENYKLSVTHLNNFLDLQYAGPQIFVERNLLQFPEMKSPALGYGSAIHAALELFQKKFRSQGVAPALPEVLQEFERSLKSQRLNPHEFKLHLEKGMDKLSAYFDKRANDFVATDISEMNFKNQDVFLEEIPLAGKIDKMRENPEKKEIVVFDYKTGGAIDDISENSTKAWKLRNQLIFYKLLVEGSRRYGGKYKVNRGVLEFVDSSEEDKLKIVEMEITSSDLEVLKRLIRVVYKKIQSLDFPDTSKYRKTLRGINEFMQDLLNE